MKIANDDIVSNSNIMVLYVSLRLRLCTCKVLTIRT